MLNKNVADNTLFNPNIIFNGMSSWWRAQKQPTSTKNGLGTSNNRKITAQYREKKNIFASIYIMGALFFCCWWRICFAFDYDKFHFKKYFAALHWREKIKQLANIHNNILSHSQHRSAHVLLSIFSVCANNRNNNNNNTEKGKQVNKLFLHSCSVPSFLYLFRQLWHRIHNTFTHWQRKQLHPFVSSFNARAIFIWRLFDY